MTSSDVGAKLKGLRPGIPEGSVGPLPRLDPGSFAGTRPTAIGQRGDSVSPSATTPSCSTEQNSPRRR